MRISPAVIQGLFAAVFMLPHATAAWTQGKQIEGGQAPLERPENWRSEYLRTLESQRELRSLQPLLLEVGLAILQELKDLEKRPQSSLGEWAETLRRRHVSPDGDVPLPVMMILEGRSKPPADDQEVREGNVQRRLIRLAITGRITKNEYDGYVRRLQGN